MYEMLGEKDVSKVFSLDSEIEYKISEGAISESQLETELELFESGQISNEDIVDILTRLGINLE